MTELDTSTAVGIPETASIADEEENVMMNSVLSREPSTSLHKFNLFRCGCVSTTFLYQILGWRFVAPAVNYSYLI